MCDITLSRSNEATKRPRGGSLSLGRSLQNYSKNWTTQVSDIVENHVLAQVQFMKIPAFLTLFAAMFIFTATGASADNSERAPTSAANEATWGQPVKGVSVRLRADRTRWTSNETPTFKLDVRNQGQREFYPPQAQESGRLEVDRVLYGWTGLFDLKSSSLPPGREYHDIPVSLGSSWKATQEWRDKTQAPPPQIPLKLLRGKHTIRFAPEIRDITVKPKPHNNHVPSNPVEIEITGESQVRVPMPKAGASAGPAHTIGDMGVADPDVPTGLLEHKGEKIVVAPAEDLALAKTYHALQVKGPLVAGQRITIMTHNTLFRMGEPVRVLHVLEAVESGKDVHLMGPKKVYEEYVDGKLVTSKGPCKDPYRGVVVDRSIADFNYEITTYSFTEPGLHMIQCKGCGASVQ